MKKLNLFLAVACAAFTMQACHNSASTGTTDSTTTMVKTDSTKVTDTSKMASAVIDTADTAFTNKAAAGGMTEIAASKLALQMSQNAKIKDFANMMITDHTMAGNKLAAIAKSKNIVLPTGPNAMQQDALTKLSKKTGSDFNMAYVNQMYKDHKETVAMFESEQNMVKDTTLKNFIIATLPTLHKHLDAITAIKSSMK
jgi:putative membrane protein